MIKNKLLIVTALFYACFLFAACNNADKYDVEVFQQDKGWGYKILKAEKTIIYQPVMPCVQGNVPFPNEEAAEETALLVCGKLQRKETPTVTINELRNIIGY